MAELPTCKDLIQRFRADAQGLLECQKILKPKGLSPDTQTQCEPLIEAMGSKPKYPGLFYRWGLITCPQPLYAESFAPLLRSSLKLPKPSGLITSACR